MRFPVTAGVVMWANTSGNFDGGGGGWDGAGAFCGGGTCWAFLRPKSVPIQPNRSNPDCFVLALWVGFAVCAGAGGRGGAGTACCRGGAGGCITGTVFGGVRVAAG